MKRIMACIVAFMVLLTSALAGFVFPALADGDGKTTKAYYSDFTNDFSGGPVSSGYGDNKISLVNNDGTTYSISGGALHLSLTNSNYLRMNNTMTDVDQYDYMAIRIKGSYDWDVLTGNSLAFWFGSYGTPGAKLYMTAEQITTDYSDVIIEIPDGYFDKINPDYRASLFITTERGAVFDVYIDEIYFYNAEPEEEDDKYLYNDFEAGLGNESNPTATGNGDNKASFVTIWGESFAWNADNGVLHMEPKSGSWLRTWNSITGLENYKYMVLRVKSTVDNTLSGNALTFKFGSGGSQTAVLGMSANELTAEYQNLAVEIPADFFSAVTVLNYRYSLWIGTGITGANYSVDIDEIYFTNKKPSSSADPEVPEETENVKYVYNNFDAGLGPDSAPTATGNGTYVAGVVNAEGGAVWSVSDGVLNLKVTNGQWLRTWNNITGLEDYKYMVLRMKGGYDWNGAVLTGNALSFKFGSAGSQTQVLTMSVDDLTEEYSDVYVEIPDPETFYQAVTATNYRYSLWIGTERGAQFDVKIDEIFFTDTKPSAQPQEDIFSLDVPLNESCVKFLGRTGGFDASNRLVLEWTNSGFSFNFTGTSFEFCAAGSSVGSNLQPYLAYSVDGADFTAVQITSSANQTIRADGLTQGKHSVRVLRTNEPIGNPIYVSALKIGSAAETALIGTPDAAANKKILFIGDSLTTAYGNTGSGNHPYSTSEQDGTKGYAYLTAEHFGADSQIVAREGRGLVSNNYAGYTDYAGDMLGVESYALNTNYNFSSWTPDLVVINLGSNDEEGKPNKTTESQMHAAVKAFLNRVRGLYPKADIIWAYDTLATADGGGVKRGILSAISELNDAKVRFCSLSTITGLGTYGHPNVTEHQNLADDLIYYIENPDQDKLPGIHSDEVIYSEFTDALVLGSSVPNGAGGSIELFGLQDGASQTVKNGALNLSLVGSDAYIRFRSSVALSEGTSSKYKYMVIRLKGGATRSDGSAVTGNMINVIFASWGNEANPVVISGSQVNSSEYTDVVLALSDQNFANSHPDYLSGLILRNAGNFNTSVEIDRIFFTNVKPESDSPAPAPVKPVTDHVYSEFNAPLVQGKAVDNGADGTITLFMLDGGTQKVSGGNLDLNLKGQGSYIRFTGSLSLSDGANSKYKYMVVRLKGGATRSDGSAVTGNMINVIFASWGNEGNPVVISGSQVSKDSFTTVVLPLSDKNFANSHPDYLSGVILRNAGNFNTSIQIDRIYFTDVKPSGSEVKESKDSGKNNVTGGKAVLSDFTYPLEEGRATDNNAGGTITLFNTEGVTQSVSGGALHLKFNTQDGYIRFSSSLNLATSANTSAYKYMVLRMKGKAAKADGSAIAGAALKVIMCSWGNEGNSLSIDASQITSQYSTIVLPLSDKNFASTHADYRGGLILRSAGNFKIDLDIDEIYFTDVMPGGALQPSNGSTGQKTQDSDKGTKDTTDSNSLNLSNGSSKKASKSVVKMVKTGNDRYLGYLLFGVFGACFLAFAFTAVILLVKRGKIR